MRAFGYARVSTDDQHLGTDAQEAAMRRWCQTNETELAQLFVDHGVSGAAPLDKRPQLLAAIDALEAGDLLVVAKRDRLARDVITAAMVDRLVTRAGGRVVAGDGAGNGDGPEAQLMRRMMDAFAEYERAVIRARTRAALAAKRRRGEKTGGEVPFGYRAPDGKHLVPDEREQRTLGALEMLRARGMSIRAIAAELNALGVPSRGQRWHPTTVARLLKRVNG